MTHNNKLRLEILRRAVSSTWCENDDSLLSNCEIIKLLDDSTLSQEEKANCILVIVQSWINSNNLADAERELRVLAEKESSNNQIVEATNLKLRAIIELTKKPESYQIVMNTLKVAKERLQTFFKNENCSGTNEYIPDSRTKVLETIDAVMLNAKIYTEYWNRYHRAPAIINFNHAFDWPYTNHVLEDNDNYLRHDELLSCIQSITSKNTTLNDFIRLCTTNKYHIYDLSITRMHLILLRYIIHSQESEAKLAGKSYWECCFSERLRAKPITHGISNPWEYIEFYRAILAMRMILESDYYYHDLNYHPSNLNEIKYFLYPDFQYLPAFKNIVGRYIKTAYNAVYNHTYPFMGLKQCILQTFLMGAYLNLTGHQIKHGKEYKENLLFLKECSQIGDEIDLKQKIQNINDTRVRRFIYNRLPGYSEALEILDEDPRSWNLPVAFIKVVPFALW